MITWGRPRVVRIVVTAVGADGGVRVDLGRRRSELRQQRWGGAAT
jgi:hypothetical protein